MDSFYEVIYEGSPVGKTELRRQGLYWGITCRCKIPDGKMYRLVASWTEGWKNLGIPVPDTEGFILKKNLPIKHLGDDNLRFVLMEAAKNPEDVLYPKPLPVTEHEEINAREDAEDAKEESPSETSTVSVPISEDEPFDRLHEIMNAMLEIREEGPVAVFDQQNSDVQTESDGAVVGSRNVSVDRGSNDIAADTV